MAKKVTLTATLPNGKTVSRTTTHDYKFVIYGQRAEEGRVWVLSWTSRLDLAEKEIDRCRSKNYAGCEFGYVEVN